MTTLRSTQPRKVPRQARAAVTVAAVIEAAARILEAEGLVGLNTNAIASKAGVSVGSLYQYFPSKDAILVALISREAEAFHVALDQTLGEIASLGLTTAVARLAGAAVRHQASRPGLSRILDLEEQRLGLDAEVGEASARTGVLIERFLAGRNLGGSQAAWDIMGLARGLIDAALDRKDTLGLEQRLSWAILGYLALSRPSDPSSNN